MRQAYYDEPAGALGMPEFTVSLYPASGGQQRIVEILLTYPEDTQALRQKSDDLQSTADALVLPLRPHQLSPSARQAELFSLVREHVRARPDGGPTAWDALLGDGADSEGLALTFQLLSGKMEVGSVLVEGTSSPPTAAPTMSISPATPPAPPIPPPTFSPWATCGRARKKMQKI